MGKKRNSIVYLEPKEHKYHHKDSGKIYRSVTTILSDLKPKFPAKEVALRISRQSEKTRNPKYKGMNQQDILAEWKKINDEANEYGTEVHEILERYLLADRVYVPKSDYEREIITKFQEVDDMTGVIYPETILFLEKYGLAGTTDIVEEHEDYFNILDFKTNKDINYVSEYGNWLNSPVSHLSDCDYNIYALQLSIYAFMFQMETRKKVGKLQIFYLNPKKEKFEVIPMPYLGLEAHKILQNIK